MRGSSNQETSLPRPPAAMDSGASTNARAGEVFDERPLKMPRFLMGHDPAAASWADVHPDILCVVLLSLPCLADRARVRSVCRNWRAAARNHGQAPPLPLLVLPKFRFSSLSTDGALTAVRRVPLPEEVATDDVRCVGSFEGWLLCVQPSKYCRDGDGECFSVNAFSHKVVRLPHPCAFHFDDSCYYRSTLPIINGSGVVYCTISDRVYAMSLRALVLSASPDRGSKSIVAAFSNRRHTHALALWRPGMKSWCVCNGFCLSRSNLVFYQEKLYMLWNFKPCLFALELEEGDCGIRVSRVERCVTEPLPHVHTGFMNCNLVEWRGNLLVIIRYHDGFSYDRTVPEVKVFALDFSTNPYGLTEIYSLDGDCIFVDSCSSKSFPAGLYDGVQGDLIYFVDENIRSGYGSPPYDTFVYNMSNGAITPFAVELSLGNFGAPEDELACPSWFFPY